ncbi:hypothetical protein GCWU000324_03053 [Kingella oralis ATCC 51147]|uniref:Uncharacterized protein n=1 Tax=Kingella oralis ATCC 51147 TaxID=629741 RepID=C4GMW7_9NEIS|nr:hypothetical protein GCWU000324_03053 [Kingella oralis ATCC 51147]
MPPFLGECKQDYIGLRGSNPRRVAKRETSRCSGRPPFRHRSRYRRNYILPRYAFLHPLLLRCRLISGCLNGFQAALNTIPKEKP